MADQQKVVHDLPNNAIFNDLERPLTHADFKGTPLYDDEYLRNGTK